MYILICLYSCMDYSMFPDVYLHTCQEREVNQALQIQPSKPEPRCDYRIGPYELRWTPEAAPGFPGLWPYWLRACGYERVETHCASLKSKQSCCLSRLILKGASRCQGLLRLSGILGILTMWSHYAKGHQPWREANATRIRGREVGRITNRKIFDANKIP